MLALETSLISKYLDFQKNSLGSDDKLIIERLFKYLNPFTMSVSQKEEIGLSDELAKSLSDGGLIRIRHRQCEDDLIEKTKLKLMLTTDSHDGTFPYPYINILEDEVDVSFTATYRSGQNRDKAKEHIRALLKDANNIKIYDRYLSKINQENDCWTNTNKQVLLDILPQKTIEINIYCQSDWTVNRETDLTTVCTQWTIVKETWDVTIHDRYIETDKVIILLSSGIINLSNSATRDFTYVVKVK